MAAKTFYSKIDIRPTITNENDSVQEMFEKVFAETFSSDIPDFEEVTKGEKIFGAYEEGRLVGFASVWEPDQFIHFLFVDQEFRKHKIGSSLVNYLSNLYGTLTLKCLLSNTTGIAFYLATGWEKVETGMCEDGEYALLRYPA